MPSTRRSSLCSRSTGQLQQGAHRRHRDVPELSAAIRAFGIQAATVHSGGTLLILHGRLGVTVKLKGADRGPTVRQCLLVAETTALPPKLVGGYVFVYRPSLCCHVSSLHPFLHAGLVQGNYAVRREICIAGVPPSGARPHFGIYIYIYTNILYTYIFRISRVCAGISAKTWAGP